MTSHLLEWVFFCGQVAAVAFLVYGAWLCFTAARERPAERAPAAEPGKAASAERATQTPEGGAWA